MTKLFSVATGLIGGLLLLVWQQMKALRLQRERLAQVEQAHQVREQHAAQRITTVKEAADVQRQVTHLDERDVDRELRQTWCYPSDACGQQLRLGETAVPDGQRYSNSGAGDAARHSDPQP